MIRHRAFLQYLVMHIELDAPHTREGRRVGSVCTRVRSQAFKVGPSMLRRHAHICYGTVHRQEGLLGVRHMLAMRTCSTCILRNPALTGLVKSPSKDCAGNHTALLQVSQYFKICTGMNIYICSMFIFDHLQIPKQRICLRAGPCFPS